MKNTSNTYYIVVLEDSSKGLVIGSASLVVEEKFIHSTGKVNNSMSGNGYRSYFIPLIID